MTYLSAPWSASGHTRTTSCTEGLLRLLAKTLLKELKSLGQDNQDTDQPCQTLFVGQSESLINLTG